MRRWLPVLLPGVVTIALLIVSSFLPMTERRRAIMLVSGVLVVATVIVSVFTKSTAAARALLATLLWSLVLFELLGTQ
jgi:hypothetical protein